MKPVKQKCVYKIRRTTDGKFSSGGSYPYFTNQGKTWKFEGHLRSHIKLISTTYNSGCYKDCVIVKYELQEVEVTPVVVKFFDCFLQG